MRTLGTQRFAPSRCNRRHHISLLRRLTRRAGGQYPRDLIYPNLPSGEALEKTLRKCVGSGAEANIYSCDVKPGSAVALRVARRSGAAPDSPTPRLKNALLAVLHKQLVHDNVLGFLGVVERMGDLCIVMPWCDKGNAVSYLESPANHSHLQNLVCESPTAHSSKLSDDPETPDRGHHRRFVIFARFGRCSWGPARCG